MNVPAPSCRTCSGIHRGIGDALYALAHRQGQKWTPEQVRGDGGGAS